MSLPPSVPRPLVECPACQGPLRSVGRLPLRRDAAQAGYIIQAQPGDSAPAVGIDTYRCQNCGRLEFYDHDFALPAV